MATQYCNAGFFHLSAYHGLDIPGDKLNVLCGFNVAGDDGIRVVFSTQLQVDRVVPESFLVVCSDGESVVPLTGAILHPSWYDASRAAPVLLTGDFGTSGYVSS